MSEPGTAPSQPSEGAKNRLRQEMDMKAVLLRHGAEPSEEQDGDVEMEEEPGDENPYDEEEQEEDDEDEALLKEWATWDMDKLREETAELENVLLHSKKVSLTSVTPHLEHRLALLRSEMKGRGTPGFQLDRASKLLERAKAQREKTEKSITALEEKLRAAKAKLKDDQAKEAAAQLAQQQIQEKIAKDMSKLGDGSVEAQQENEVVKAMAQGIAAKLPHFQGMMSYSEVQLTLQKIVVETAQEMQAKHANSNATAPNAAENAIQQVSQQAAHAAAGLPAGGQAVAQRVQQTGQSAHPVPPAPAPQAVQPRVEAPSTPQGPAHQGTAGAGSRPVHPVMLAAGGQHRQQRMQMEAARGRSRTPTKGTGRSTSITAEMVKEWT